MVERRLVWQCGVLCCVVHPLCVWSPLFGTHHPLCLHTSHSNQPPLDGVVRWCESTTVPLSISLFTVCECEWQETRVVMVTMKAPSHSIAITNTTTTSMSTICTHTHLSGLLGLVAHHMHHGVCGMATIATSTPLLPHTHTTVTVIGGTAKQLLGSSTDWCATTIVTPHTRGATSTHTHGWQSGVVWPMC